MKAGAASGNPTKISANTDSQSENSRKSNPGMQFFLLLLISTLLYLWGGGGGGGSDC